MLPRDAREQLAREISRQCTTPTEGGLFTGLYEVAKASDRGIFVLIVRERTAESMRRYEEREIKAIEIGEIRDKENGLKTIDAEERDSDLVYSGKDELIRKIL